MPRVLNKYKDKIPDDAVYIGRPSRWGNPYIIGKDGDRDQVVDKFEQNETRLISLARQELVGRDLVCFCAPHRCHGDVLLKWANSEEENVE